MSVVYEVEHAFTKEHLALKVLKGNAVTLDSLSLARFRREARMSALMKSEHVVRVVDADIAPELDGAPYLVMDLLEGADLASVAGRKPQPAERVVAWFRQAARALDLAHQLGVIHRDLKPENLFLTVSRDGGPLVKVLDFGVASIPMLDEATGTRTGAFVGTPLFMSPEQASGAEVQPAADVWSVGISVFRLLSGEDYWIAPSVTLLLAKIVYEEVIPPSRRGVDRGPAFDEWFLTSCARDPRQRWSSVGEQIEALAAALGYPVLDIPVLPEETELRVQQESANFDLSDRFGDRSHSLGGSVSSRRPNRATRALAPMVAFATAVVAVALQFGRGHAGVAAGTARSDLPLVPAPAARENPAPPVTPPPITGTSVSAPPSVTTPSANIESLRAALSAADRSRWTRKSALAPSAKKPIVAAAPATTPARESPAPSQEPHVHDPLADPD